MYVKDRFIAFNDKFGSTFVKHWVRIGYKMQIPYIFKNNERTMF